MTISEIAKFAKIKGLNVVGTGDFTHPKWIAELRMELEEVLGTGLYRPRFDPKLPVQFMMSGEVSTIFSHEGMIKKIHHVILAPSIETAEQINEALSKYGNLSIDGRPTFNATAPEVTESIMEVSSENVVIPSHAWTPWFSIFGAFSGFDRVEDCYQDTTKYIFAIETGLSSDPPMNWRLSALDKYALVSNSDSHSAWPWRIGREANVFELERVTYQEVIDAIRKRDPKRFKCTIEVNPAYGKYHWTGHRGCGVSMPPEKAIALGDICPTCRRKLTRGVEERVEELADREPGFRPEGAIDYVHLLPLHEIVSSVTGSKSLTTTGVWSIYRRLVDSFGDEYTVLMEAPLEEMERVVEPKVAEAIVRVREGKVRIDPGYDGVYGKLKVFEEGEVMGKGKYPRLEDFW